MLLLLIDDLCLLVCIPPSTTTYFKSVGILKKCVGKISWPNVVGKFGVFIIKKEMQNYINIQSRRNQTFTGDNRYKIL